MVRMKHFGLLEQFRVRIVLCGARIFRPHVNFIVLTVLFQLSIDDVVVVVVTRALDVELVSVLREVERMIGELPIKHVHDLYRLVGLARLGLHFDDDPFTVVVF